MPSTYTVNLGIEKPATGEQSGTWGDTTNVNFDIIDQAVNGSERVTLTSAGTSGSPNDLNIVNGSTTSSEGRNKWIEIYSASDLGGSAYVRLVPNDAEKILFIRNSLAGSQSVLLFQGTYNASNDLEIPAGVDMVVKFDGAGASATVTDVFTKLRATEITTPTLTAGTADINGGSIDGATVGASSASTGAFTTLTASTSLNIASSTTVDGVLDEDNMASNSATKLATQQSIKAYVDSQVGTVDTLAEILANGNTSGANNLIISNGQALTSNTINETTAGSGVTIDSVLLKDDSVNAATLEVTTLKANDGTAAGSIANSTGVVTLTSVDINGGNIDGTTIGATSTANGNFSTLNATDIETSNISANDGTASASIADSTGVMTITSSVLTTVDINGGTIDNTTIGQTTPRAGDFTTLGATTSLNVGTSTTTHLIQAYDSSSTANSFGLGQQVATARSMRLEKLDNTAADPYALNFYFSDHPTSASGSINFFASQADDPIMRLDNIGDFALYDGADPSIVWDQSSEFVINQPGNDRDFRVESSTQSSAFFVEGGGKFITFGSSAQNAALATVTAVQINGTNPTGDGPELLLHNAGQGSAARAILSFGAKNSSVEGYAAQIYTTNNDGLHFNTNASVASGFVEGSLRLRIGPTGAFQQYADAGQAVSFNEDGANVDFRVESSGNANMLFVDADADKIGVGTNSPAAPLSVSATGDANYGVLNISGTAGNPTLVTLNRDGSQEGGIYIQRSTTPDLKVFVDANETSIIQYNAGNTGDSLQLIQGAGTGALVATFDSSNNIIFNDNSGAYDFRVESDTSSHALFVDGSANRVGLFTSSPQAALDVGSGNILGHDSSIDHWVMKVQGNTSGSNIHYILICKQGGSTAYNTRLTGRFTGCRSSGVTASGSGMIDVDLFINDAETVITAGAVTFTGQSAYGNAEGKFCTLTYDDGGGAATWYALEISGNYTSDWDAMVFTGFAKNIDFTMTTGGSVSSVSYLGQSSEYLFNQTKVGVRTNNTAASLNVGGDAGGAIDVLQLRNDNASYSQSYTWNLDTSKNLVVTGASASGGYKWNGGTNGFVINEDSNDMDFRVESDSNTHALFVDASADKVGINNSAPTAPLDVRGTSKNSYNTLFEVINVVGAGGNMSSGVPQTMLSISKGAGSSSGYRSSFAGTVHVALTSRTAGGTTSSQGFTAPIQIGCTAANNITLAVGTITETSAFQYANDPTIAITLSSASNTSANLVITVTSTAMQAGSCECTIHLTGANVTTIADNMLVFS